jgi:protein gp37
MAKMWHPQHKSNGLMQLGTLSRGALRSHVAATSVMRSGSLNDSEVCPAIHSMSGFDLKLRPERLTQPLAWRQPRRIFVNSMSDLFHKEIPRSFIDSVFETMEAADWHTFQVLTKRSSLMARYLRNRYGTDKAPPHIWLGVSIEDEKNTIRLSHLRAAAAATKFVSFEPLLGPVGKIDLGGINWAIVGGESGPGARPMLEEWAIEIQIQCKAAKVAFFFKQWGGVRPKSGGRLLRRREWNDYPRIDNSQPKVYQRAPVWA